MVRSGESAVEAGGRLGGSVGLGDDLFLHHADVSIGIGCHGLSSGRTFGGRRRGAKFDLICGRSDTEGVGTVGVEILKSIMMLRLKVMARNFWDCCLNFGGGKVRKKTESETHTQLLACLSSNDHDSLLFTQIPTRTHLARCLHGYSYSLQLGDNGDFLSNFPTFQPASQQTLP